MELVKKFIVAVVISLGLLAGGCGESVDPNMADVKLKMKAISSTGSFDASGRVLDNHITFNQVLLGVIEIEFESEEDHYNDDSMDDENDEGYESEYEIEFEGEFVVDLIDGTSTPDFGISDVFPGRYVELEVELAPILDDGNSIFIELTYQPEGSDPVTIQYSCSKYIEIEIENENGFELNEGTLNQILVLFDLDQLLVDLNLDQLNVDDDGIIRINCDSNSDIANAIWDKLEMAFDAGDDDDGDDEFDDDEDDEFDDDED